MLADASFASENTANTALTSQSPVQRDPVSRDPVGRDPVTYLKRYFGYDQFRPMQEAIIRSVLAGRDTLVLMPTGGGKSVCFQIPAVMLPGITVVVSPLIALMKDQVEALQLNGIPAVYLNSTQTAREQRQIEDDCLSGKIKLLYTSPEKLLSESFFIFLQKLNISLFAIDEAHCISSWGHDFRPEYTQLNVLRDRFPQVPMVALTATADKLTRQDIAQRLGMVEPEVFVASFNRPNLSLQVLPGTNRFGQIVRLLQMKPDTSGIIYCLSRKATETLATKLQEKGLMAGFYHAGMSNAERSMVQEMFLKDDIRIMCATIAFGMGIDKSNVRWVIHYNMPKNMEGFYQEIGRAGRDGSPADTVLFYSFADVATYKDMLNEARPANLGVQLAKLERMQQYADAHTCRRRILLSYFSEELTEPCGNCDICRNPRVTFDGTILAQKALSAIVRVQERVPMNLLIDILRGSRSQTVLQYGYDKVKTYGAGKDLKFEDWRNYLHQLINIGVIEVAYDQHYALKKGILGDAVLFEGRKIELVRPEDVTKPVAEKAKSKTQQVKDELFERLRILRKQVADEQNVPPYVIFTDTTLEDMARQRPTTADGLRNVSGVGERKLQLFGRRFLDIIVDYVRGQVREGNNLRGSTHLATLELYEKGMGIEQIASQRQITTQTVLSHLIYLRRSGYTIDLESMIDPWERAEIERAIGQIGIENNSVKPIFDYFDGRYSYDKIRLTVALMEI